jgi:hypothetical protein
MLTICCAGRVAIADCLCQVIADIADGNIGNDECFAFDPATSVLIDRGLPGHSEIYRQACDLVAGAARVHCVSQFGPTGPLARLLKFTNTTYYFNRSCGSNVALGLMLSVDKLISGARTSYVGKDYIHAKFILAERIDGSMALLAGSHNFKYQGVRNGTIEIALLTTDQGVCELVRAYLLHTFAAESIY